MTDEEYLEQIKNINPNKYPDKTLFWLRNLILRAFEKNLKLGIVSNYKNEENLIPESVVPFDNLRKKYDNVAIYYSVMYRGGYLLNYFGFALAVTVAACVLGLLYLDAITNHKFKEIIEVGIIILGLLKLGIICTIINNTRDIGENRINQKHIDFRYVAERLRIVQAYSYLGQSCKLAPKLGEHLMGAIKNYPGELLFHHVRLNLPSNFDGKKYDNKAVQFLVDDQINFHSDRAICHCKYAEKLEHKAEMLNKAVLYLVIADLIIAILYWLSGFCDFHFQPLTLLHSLTGLLILLTISLPALVAAYTGITAQSEYYKLSLRNIRLKKDLIDASSNLKPYNQNAFDEISQKLLDEVIEWTLIYEKKVHEL